MFSRHRQELASSVIAHKALLDPSAVSVGIIGRRAQSEALVDLLAHLERGYLPPLIQVFGAPGTGKTSVCAR